MVVVEIINNSLSNILSTFEQFTSKPETFVSIKENLSGEIKQFLKQTYDTTKNEEEKNITSNALPELIVQNFDDEQIFQQIELQNEVLLNTYISKVSKLAVAKDRLMFNELNGANDFEASKSSGEEEDNDLNLNKDGSKSEEEDDDLDHSGGEDIDGEVSDNQSIIQTERNKKSWSSVVDDKFFKLNEMNDFLLSQEKDPKQKKMVSGEESESEEEDVDMFEASEEGEVEEDFEGNDKTKNPRYKDFFSKKVARNPIEEAISSVDDKVYMDTMKSKLEQRVKGLKRKNDVSSNIDDNGNKDTAKSNLELREERLKRKIDEIEDAAVSEKPWQLKGEVTGENRPLNSLLEEVLEFDLTTRPAPVVTEETTYILEDVIKQRIKDKVFDDVQRKQKPVDTPLEFKKKLILDQEKSKESLAQIYEKEYLKQKEALSSDQAEKEEEEPKLHQEVKSLMHSLFTKLDALSNFHFTPKPITPELRVVNNLPAISMEEVAPVAASDAALLAPEEVQSKVNSDIIGTSERTKTDKKRERRKKKQKQKVHAQEKKKKDVTVNKLRPGLGNKYSKEKMKKLLDVVTKDTNVDKMNHSYDKKIKSSTAFFSQLQENVTSQIKLQKNKGGNSKNIKQRDVKSFKL